MLTDWRSIPAGRSVSVHKLSKQYKYQQGAHAAGNSN